MTITCENKPDVIVYAFEKIIFFARENQYLFVGNPKYPRNRKQQCPIKVQCHQSNTCNQRISPFWVAIPGNLSKE
jgi:hypothetical protein